MNGVPKYVGLLGAAGAVAEQHHGAYRWVGLVNAKPVGRNDE